jgi:hypothetical protein
MASTRRRIATLIAAPAVLLGGLAFAPSASALVYCVDVTGGDCNVIAPDPQVADPQSALNAAANNPGQDFVRLGSMTYTAPSRGGFNYSGSDPVGVIGQGAGATTLTVAQNAGGALVFVNGGGPGSSLSDLTVRIPTPIAAEQYYGVYGGNNASFDLADLRVEAPAPFNGFGMLLEAGGSVDDTTVALPNGGAGNLNTGIQSYSNLSITDTNVAGDTGISYSPPVGTLTMRRTSIDAFGPGITLEAGDMDIASSVIETQSTGVSVGNGNGGALAESFTATLDGVTIAAHGPFGSTGVRAFTNNAVSPATTPADNHSVTISNSILDQSLDTAILREADDNGTASVTTSFSNLNPASNISTNNPDGDGADAGMGTIDPLGGDVNVVSGFVNPGTDFHLMASSPLLDIGDPASPGTGPDIDGDPRAVLATPLCSPRRDIGADEFVPASPVTPPASCNPPAITPTTVPPPSTTAPPPKKCKKGRKLKKGKCVKKKRKKR